MPPPFSRPLTHPPGGGVTAQLEQRLGDTQVELRKLGSERHTLRARLRREADRLRELESALRAEKKLRDEAADEQFGAVIGLRTRLAEVESERDASTAQLSRELERSRVELESTRTELESTRAELEQARTELESTRAELEQARTELEQALSRPSSDGMASTPLAAAARAVKVAQGLRRIRGIGPAYQRMLEQFGITRVQQVAQWSDTDVLTFADRLKIRADRIIKDAWVSQAQALEPDAEG